MSSSTLHNAKSAIHDNNTLTIGEQCDAIQKFYNLLLQNFAICQMLETPGGPLTILHRFIIIIVAGHSTEGGNCPCSVKRVTDAQLVQVQKLVQCIALKVCDGVQCSHISSKTDEP